jgi:predicted ATPase
MRSGETRVEVMVGRLPLRNGGGSDDLVPIADVGFGVSQALPIAVALVAAEPGDWIYVEEPESHLHPRAQARLGTLLAQAALRGVRVVIETHSSILLRSIQTLVAKDVIDKDLVKLHWCTRDPKTGATNVQLAELKNDGSFGEWTEDFADVEMDVERAYLNAASARHR